MPDDKATSPESFAAPQRDYVRQLPERLAAIEAGWSRLTQTSWEEGALRELRRAVHALVDPGVTFGLGEIGNAARAFEILLKEAVATPGRPATAILNRLTAALDALRFAITSVAPVSTAVPAEDARVKATTTEKTWPLLYLIEDDQHLLALLGRQIARYGFTVQTFESLAEVTAAMIQQKPVAVISDVNLPGSEGIAGRVHDAMREALVPLIMISAQDDIETRLKAVRAGASAFLLKPVNLDELMDHVERLTNPPAVEAYRILIVEDSLVLGEYCTATLRNAGMLVELVNDPIQAWAAIQRIVPDLVLMELYLPGCSGMEMASIIRQQPSYMGIPIVFLSAENENHRTFSALGFDSDDFFTKPIEAERLVRTVGMRAARARLLRAGMLHDGLTGTLNHSTVIDRLHSEISHAARQKTPLMAVLIDIDHFKTVNDTYGHLMGDQVLRGLTRLLRPRLRKSDSLGRYGGEEFLLILPDTSQDAALRLTNELRVMFSETQHRSGGRTFSVTFSAGLAAWTPDMSAVDVIDAADQALYRSKREGRNRVTAAKPPVAPAILPPEEGGHDP